MTSGQPALYLGADGGRSGTRALVIDAGGTIRGYGRGGDANHGGQGVPRAVRHVADAIAQACSVAGVAPSDLAGTHLALAGDDVSDDHERLTEALQRILPGMPFNLSNDVWAGLRAGSVSGVGVAVNCGSGTGVVGRNSRGDGVIIPDLGYIFGDSGGGTQIAVDAFRAVIRAWDGRGAPTTLTTALLELTGHPDVGALYMAIYREEVERSCYGSVTRLVFQHAASGDAVATAILERIGGEMGVSALAVARRLGLQEDTFPFVLTGGAVRTLRSPLVEAATARLRTVAPRCQPTLPLLLPVAGAVLLALDAAGRPVTESHYAALQEQGYGWHPEEFFDQAN